MLVVNSYKLLDDCCFGWSRRGVWTITANSCRFLDACCLSLQTSRCLMLIPAGFWMAAVHIARPLYADRGMLPLHTPACQSEHRPLHPLSHSVSNQKSKQTQADASNRSQPKSKGMQSCETAGGSLSKGPGCAGERQHIPCSWLFLLPMLDLQRRVQNTNGGWACHTASHTPPHALSCTPAVPGRAARYDSVSDVMAHDEQVCPVRLRVRTSGPEQRPVFLLVCCLVRVLAFSHSGCVSVPCHALCCGCRSPPTHEGAGCIPSQREGMHIIRGQLTGIGPWVS